MHRHNNTSGGLPGKPERANALILKKGIFDNPFLTPPEAFVKDYLNSYQPWLIWTALTTSSSAPMTR